MWGSRWGDRTTPLENHKAIGFHRNIGHKNWTPNLKRGWFGHHTSYSLLLRASVFLISDGCFMDNDEIAPLHLIRQSAQLAILISDLLKPFKKQCYQNIL